MKMVECMEDEAPISPKGEIEKESPRRIKSAQVMGAMVTTNESGAKVSWGFKTIRRSWQTRSH
jgi:hypothetical protein